LILTASYIGFAMVMFLYFSTIIHVGLPFLMILFAVLSTAIFQYIYEEKEQDAIRDTFGRYLSNEVVKELLDSPTGTEMSGEIREMTFLVSDLRGFTTLTSKLSPHEIIEIMNRYFEHMIEVISKYRGVIKEFLGDGILVFFGAPLQAGDDPQRAVACAIEMQNEMLKVNEKQRNQKLPDLRMGIGINTGDTVVGNIGSKKRASYGAIGNAINTAFRIESFTVGGQILISQSTYDKVQSIVKTQGAIKKEFKGLSHPVNIYDVAGLAGIYQVELPQKEGEKFVRLNLPVPIECHLIQGKTISDTKIHGFIEQLSNSMAKVVLEQPIQSHTNVKVFINPHSQFLHSEEYAKVFPADNPDSSSAENIAYLHFASMPVVIQQFLIECKSPGK